MSTLSKFEERGEAKGEIKGKIKRDIEIILAMHQEGFSVKKISSILKVDEDFVKKAIESEKK